MNNSNEILDVYRQLITCVWSSWLRSYAPTCYFYISKAWPNGH